MIAPDTCVRSITRGFADLLVTFGAGPPAMSRSGRGWQDRRTAESSCSVWIQQAPSSDRGLLGSIVTERRTAHWTVWLLGELFGYRGCRQGAAFEAWCEDLDRETTVPRELNGHFALVARDERDGSWHAWTNRLGTVHLYYAAAAGRASFGTFYPAVADAASRKALDWHGLTGFFAFGFFPEDRTFFDDVRILRPATHFVWDHAGCLMSESRYWEWEFAPAERSYGDTVEEFGATLGRILRDHTEHGRIALPISSGLDSRTLAAVISADGAPVNVWSYSYGYTDESQETRIAARIAAARRMQFCRFTIPPYLFDRLDTALSTAEGFQSVTSTRQVAISDQIASHADYLLAGHWGDVWMSDMGLPEATGVIPASTLVDHCFVKMAKPGRDWLLQRVAAPRVGAGAVDAILRGSIGGELRRLDRIESPDFRVKAYKTEQWSFRWTVPSLRTFQTAAYPRLPFYDNRMVDFCSTIPASYLTGRRLQIDYLKRRHPDLARVTWDVTDSSLFFQGYYDSLLLPKRAAKKLMRAVSQTPVISRNWEVQFFSHGMRTRLEQHLLAPGLKVHEFVDVADVRELVHDLYTAPTRENGYTVSQLLTLAAWLEEYA